MEPNLQNMAYRGFYTVKNKKKRGKNKNISYKHVINRNRPKRENDRKRPLSKGDQTRI